MRWVTRDRVHLDRVASAWLIRRFIDPEAEILLLPASELETRPPDAVPFGIPGVEFSSHDEHGTTFAKLARSTRLDDPALGLLAAIVASGVHNAVRKAQADENDVPALEGIGLNALSEGMMLVSDGDESNIRASMPIYDALYAYCQARVLMVQDPAFAHKSFFEVSDALKNSISARLTSWRAPD